MTLDWTVFNTITELAREDLREVNRERLSLLERWNTRLLEFGGDPSARDWSRFRPLRLSREEDWSDWLAHFLETSRTGHVARELFGGSFEENYELGACTVTREERTEDGERRGDLVIAWEDGAYAHVEVKVGDTSFDKTFETGRKLHERHPDAREWRNFVLAPTEDMDMWEESKEREDDEGVDEFTWDDVAVAFRRALAAGDEDLVWNVWAYAFIGAVEQQILGHPVTGKNSQGERIDDLAHLDRLAGQTGILKKGLDHDR